MRTAARVLFNPAYVTAVYSVALGPVVRKDTFSRQRKPKENNEKTAGGFAERLLAEISEEKHRYLMDEAERTIDLIA